MNRKHKITARINLLLIGVLFTAVTAASIYAVTAFNSAILTAGNETAEILSDSYTQQINTAVGKAIYIAEHSAGSLSADLWQSRNTQLQDILTEKLTSVAKLSPEIVSVFYLSDREDVKLKDTISFHGYDENPYIYVKHTPDGYFATARDADFRISEVDFAFIRKNRTLLISDPFIIRYAERDVVAITVLTPVEEGNRLSGVLGFNYLLTDIEDLMNKPFGKLEGTHLILLTDKKNIVFVSGKKWISTKRIEDYKGEVRQLYDLASRPEVLVSDFNFAFSKRMITFPDKSAWEFYSFIPRNVIMKNLLDNILQTVIISAFIVLVGLFLLMILIRKKLNIISVIESQILHISQGKLTTIQMPKQNDEFASIIEHLNNTQSVTLRIKDRISLLHKGNLDQYAHAPQSETETMLEKLRTALIDQKQSYESEKQKAEIQLWIRRGRFEAANAQMKSPHNLEELSVNILKTIMNYSGAYVAGMYYYYNKANPPYLQAIAAFAYNDVKHLKRKFTLGEGLIGTCAIERKVIKLNNLPESYLEISTGLNTLSPKFIYVTPIIYLNELFAVCEYMFPSEPEAHVLDYIEQLSVNLGGWLDTAKNSSESEEHILQSERLANLLREKEAELLFKINTLEEKQTLLQTHFQHTEKTHRTVEDTLMRVEFNPDGVIISANSQYLKLMGLDEKQVVGKNVMDVADEFQDEIRTMLYKVRKGEIVKRTIKRRARSGELKTILATYYPQKNLSNTITSILFIGINLSEYSNE